MPDTNTLITDNLPLAYWYARRYRRINPLVGLLPWEDCVQAALLGLVRAAPAFDPARGVTFSAYAWYFMRESMQLAAAKQIGCVGLPEYFVARKRTNLSGQVRQHIQRATCPVEVRARRGWRAGDQAADHLERDNALLEREVSPGDHAARLDAEELLATLTTRERIVVEAIVMRGESREEAGWRLGVSGARVYQIKERAMGKLRRAARTGVG